jgi:hypothetical protein
VAVQNSPAPSVTAAEPRIKCADIIGYLNPWEQFAINRANWCGSQMVVNSPNNNDWGLAA